MDTEMTNQWVVHILGRVSVENGDVVIDQFPTRRALLILIRLALAHGRSVARDTICYDLWPDEFLDVTRHRLRQELTRLRNALGQAVNIIVADRASIRLDASIVDVDLKRAERLLVRGAVEEDIDKRLELFQRFAAFSDELAPGFNEPWIDSVRQDWRTRASRRLIEAAKTAKEIAPELAIAFARKASAINPLSESVQSAYIEILVALGRRDEAVSHLKELDQCYRNLLGTGPTDRLVRALGPRPQSAHSKDKRTHLPVNRRLPAALTELIGRKTQIDELLSLLQPESAVRLCTLNGIGGIGKTELALAVGRRLYDTYSDRLWFVPLAAVDDPRFLGKAVQEALGIASFGEDPLDVVASSLGIKSALLILDNLEQLADGGAQIVRRLLERCGQLKLLVTSRRKLRIQGEYEYRVPTLDPVSATQLFCQIACRMRPSFSTEVQNLEAVIDVVNLLDRLPLAIQLAASRSSVLTPADILSQLSRRFDLLVSRRVDIEPRHRGLRQAIAWSFEHLRPESKQFLVDLSLFRGGWTATLVEEVLDRPESQGPLEELCENSFIFEERTADGSRFNMLHSIREFAEEKQDASRTEAHLRKLSTALSRLAELATKHLLHEDQVRWYERLESEHENMRRVLRFASIEDPVLGVQLCSWLWRFWNVKSHHEEACGWFQVFLPADAPQCARLASALFGAGRCAMEQGDLRTAENWYRRSRNACQATERLLRVVDINLAEVYLSQGRYEEAIKTVNQVFASVDITKDGYLEGVSRDVLMMALTNLGRYDEAKVEGEAAIAILGRYEDRLALSYASMSLGRLQMKMGNEQEALDCFQRECLLHEKFGNRTGTGQARQFMAELYLRQGQYVDLESQCAESVKDRTAIGDRFGMGHLELILAEAAQRQGNAVGAAEHLAQAHNHFLDCGCETLLELNIYADSGKAV